LFTVKWKGGVKIKKQKLVSTQEALKIVLKNSKNLKYYLCVSYSKVPNIRI